MATPNYLTSSLARKYYRQMKAGLRNGGQPSSVGAGNDIYQYGREASQAQPKVASARTPKDEGGALTGIIDFISQPYYAMTQNAEDTAAKVLQKDWLGALGEQFDSDYFGRNTKTTASDVLRGDADTMNRMVKKAYGTDLGLKEDIGPLATNETDSGVQKFLKGAGGFAADIALDPLTYVSGGAVGLAAKGVGQGIKAAGAGTKAAKAAGVVGDAVEATGSGIIKADDFINALPGKAVQALKPNKKVAPAALEAEIAPKVSPAAIADEAPAPAAAAPEIEAPEAITPDVPEYQPFMSSLLDDTTPRTLAKQRMLRDVTTGEEIPYSTNAARKSIIPEYDFTKVLDDSGRLGTPFNQKTSIKVNQTPAPVSLADQLAVGEQAVKDADALLDGAARNQAADIVEESLKPITPADLKAWVNDPANAKVMVKVEFPGTKGVPAIKTSMTIEDAVSRLGKQKAAVPLSARARAGINKALQEASTAALTAARRPQITPQEVAGAPVPGLMDDLAAPGGSAAQVIDAPLKTETITNRSWVQKPKQARESLMNRYRAILEKEHFDYLYENMSRADLTNAQKVTDFRARLASLKKGMGLKDTPRYEEFARYQMVFTPQPIMPSRKKAWALSDRPADKFEEAVGDVTPASEIAKKVDNSLPATRDRDAARVMSGSDLDEMSTKAIREALGKDYIRGDATGQQWVGRNDDFVFESDIQQTARNAEVPGTGRGVNIEAYNAHAQANMFRSLLNSINDEIKQSGVQFTRKNGQIDGYARARHVRRELVPRLRAIENYLRSHGVEPIGGTSKTGIPISLADTLDILTATAKGTDFVDRRIFGGAWGIKPKGHPGSAPGTVYVTSLMRVMGAVADSMDAVTINAARVGSDDLMEAVRSALYNTVTNKAGLKVGDLKALLTNNGELPISTAKRVRARNGEEMAAAGSDQTGWAVDVTPEGKAYFGPHSTQIMKELDDVLFNDRNIPKTVKSSDIDLETGEVRVAPDFTVVHNLVQNIQQRSAEYGIRYGDNVRQLTERSMSDVINFLDSEPGLKDAVDYFQSPRAIVNAASDSRTIKPTPDELDGAQLRFEEDLTDFVSARDLEHMQNLREVSDGLKGGDVAKTNRAMDKVRQSVAKELDETEPDVVIESLRDAEVADATGMLMRIGSWTTSKFVPSRVVKADGNAIGVNGLHEAYLATGSLGRNLSQEVRRNLNEIARASTKEEQRAAYQFLQRGMVGQVPQKVREIAQMMSPVNGMFFDAASNQKGTTSGILQDFFNRGYNLDHVAEKMAAGHFGIPEGQRFDFDAIRKFGKTEDKVNELHKQWQKMKIDDPLDYMARLDATVGNLAVDTSISQQSWAKLRELGMLSDRPKPGFVKLTDRDANIITRYFPGEADNIFVDKEVVPWVKKLDELMSASTNFGGGFGKFVNGVYDPLFGMWKSGMTIWRPGHHVRNLVGDVSLSFLMDGVKDPKYYYKAVRFLGDRKQYDGVDMLRMLQGLPTTRQAEARGAIKAHLGRGKPVSVPDEEFYDAMFRRGIIKDFVQQEDIIESTQVAKPIAAMQQKMQVFGGKGRSTVGRISEARDDFVRIAHALHLMENPSGIYGRKQYKNLDEMFDAVAAQVNRVHPDGTDMTGFERKFNRRVFSFYSWTRKAIPLVVEAMLMHPGRITMYPKAMYNWAEANGVDVDSMSDPFPDDQLFPSWITSKTTGPIHQADDGSYFGIAPGVTDQDVIQEFLSPHVGSNVLDMLSPALKLPIELKTGETFGAGIQTPGTDPLQYIGSQIPGIQHVQGLTGVDPLGSVGTLATGQGLDNLTAVDKGNRENFELHRFMNFLLGTGITDYSTPSTINAAEIEKRDRS